MSENKDDPWAAEQSDSGLERYYEPGADLSAFEPYGEMLRDILPAEHYLWQMKEALPCYDAMLQKLYAEVHEGKAPDKEWPNELLIPQDFYAKAIVAAQTAGLLPEDSYIVGRHEKGDTEFPFRPPAPVAIKIEELTPGDCVNEETGETYGDVISDVHARLAAANWEVFKDVVRYSPGDFKKIVKRGAGLKGFLPKPLFTEVDTMGFWISLMGQDFEIQSELCYGVYVYRGKEVKGPLTLNAGFVTRNSYYDYSLTIAPHATLDYIMESDAELSSLNPDGTVDEEAKRTCLEELRDAWSRILPVVVHAFRNFAKCREATSGRGGCARGIMRLGGLESTSVTVWTWSGEEKSFEAATVPSVLRGPLRRTFLCDFLENESYGPMEMTPDPDVDPTLN